MTNLKKLVVAAVAGCALFASAASQAAYTTTEAGYQGYQIAANQRDTSGAGAIVSGDDTSANFLLPFAFSFYGQNYAAGSEAWVSTNGLLGFDLSNRGAYCCSAQPAGPTNTVLAGWFDLVDTVSMTVLGAPGMQELVFTWDGGEYGTGAHNRFQAILHEGSNDIEFQISELNSLSHNATVGGVRGDATTSGIDFINTNRASLSDMGLLISTHAQGGEVPEPASALLLGLGMAGLALARRSVKKAGAK
jgi:hypothetical protein